MGDSRVFEQASQEADSLAAELAALKKENLKLRDEIERAEKDIKEKTASLMQAGYKPKGIVSVLSSGDSDKGGAPVIASQFSTFESRIKTFAKWPYAQSTRPLATPVALASQGFYFAPDDQYNDRVVCAYCNLVLMDWGPKDDPIREHALRSSACPVVSGKVHALHARDPEKLMDIVKEEERCVAKLQVLEMGMRKQLEQYTGQIKADRLRREELEKALNHLTSDYAS